MRLAIYDLDKTITRRATFTPFLAFAAWQIAPFRLLLLPAWVLLMLAYKARLMDRTALKTRGMKLMLGNTDTARLEHIGRAFARRRISAGGLMPGAVRLLEQDRASGATIAIATAAFDFYARAFAAELGIGHLIATQWDGRTIPGGNCYGAAKLDRVLAWMQQHGFDPADVSMRFVSDSFADAPLLDLAGDALFATRDTAAAAKAAQRGWTAIDLTR